MRQQLDSDNLQAVLDSGANTVRVGRQQYFTPPEIAAALMAPLPRVHPLAVDLQMGQGSLLLASGAKTCLGIDIDSRLARRPPNASPDFHTLCADLTEVAPLLVEVDWKADLFVLNPPFSIQWHTERLAHLAGSHIAAVSQTFDASARHTDSTLATFMLALDRMTYKGEGLLICNEATAIRFFGNPDAVLPFDTFPLRHHIWTWLSLPPGVFPDTHPFTTAVLYFSRRHCSANPVHLSAADATPAAISRALAPACYHRSVWKTGNQVHQPFDCSDTATLDAFNAVKAEYLSRHSDKPRPWNIWLQPDGTIARHLTPFQAHSHVLPKGAVANLNAIAGKSPLELVVQKATRVSLQQAVTGGIWVVQPELITAVHDAITAYNSVRAPFYPLNSMQRIGYLDEEDTILCTSPIASEKGKPLFVPGARYPLESATAKVERASTRINFVGEEEQLTISGQELCFWIKDELGQRHSFISPPAAANNTPERSHPLEHLPLHFEIPEVPDVAQVHAARFQANLAALQALELRINASHVSL